MKLEAGKAKYPIPEHSSVALVVLQDGDYQRFLIVLHDPDPMPKTALGCPKHCAVSADAIEFWPTPDKDYTVRVRYLPPVQEI